MSADNSDYPKAEVRLPAYRECPVCGAYMMDTAKHRDWHAWLDRQLAAASVGFPAGLMP